MMSTQRTKPGTPTPDATSAKLIAEFRVRRAGSAPHSGSEEVSQPRPTGQPPEKDLMRIAYLTLDVVNANEAVRLGGRCRQDVHLVDLRSPDLADESFLVIDLDYVPASEHERLSKTLLPRPSARLAVHGYNLSPDTARRLVRAGVVVRRRLDMSLFRQLCDRAPAPLTVAGRQRPST
jgi:hypothetical protein